MSPAMNDASPTRIAWRSAEEKRPGVDPVCSSAHGNNQKSGNVQIQPEVDRKRFHEALEENTKTPTNPAPWRSGAGPEVRPGSGEHQAGNRWYLIQIQEGRSRASVNGRYWGRYQAQLAVSVKALGILIVDLRPGPVGGAGEGGVRPPTLRCRPVGTADPPQVQRDEPGMLMRPT